MKKLLSITAALTLALPIFAGEAKEVTLKGTGMCASCTLKVADSCTNALQVKAEDGNIKTYIFTENMKHGAYFCSGKTENLIVKGLVAKKDGKLTLKPISVEKKEDS